MVAWLDSVLCMATSAASIKPSSENYRASIFSGRAYGLGADGNAHNDDIAGHGKNCQQQRMMLLTGSMSSTQVQKANTRKRMLLS